MDPPRRDRSPASRRPATPSFSSVSAAPSPDAPSPTIAMHVAGVQPPILLAEALHVGLRGDRVHLILPRGSKSSQIFCLLGAVSRMTDKRRGLARNSAFPSPLNYTRPWTLRRSKYGHRFEQLDFRLLINPNGNVPARQNSGGKSLQYVVIR
jgi:hypothetical protein